MVDRSNDIEEGAGVLGELEARELGLGKLEQDRMRGLHQDAKGNS
jgi:hypothetical protein